MLLLKNKKIVSGIILLVIAFFVLSKTDPYGKNFASRVVSFIFVLSWFLIGWGILKG